MKRFTLSRQAATDLDAIADYTAERWGKPQARLYLDALQGRLAELAQQPHLGRRRDELADGLLAFPFESHVIFYAQAEVGIIVARILHKRQDAPGHFE